MSGSVNKVILIGNLGKSPEIRFSSDGSKIATFSVATSDVWKDKMTGERKDRTEWHKVVVFNDKLAEVVEKYLQKGSKVYLEGQLQTRKWTDQQGIDRYSTEVVLQKFRGELTMLDPKGSSGDGSSYGSDAYGASIPSSFDTSPLGSSLENPAAESSSSAQRFGGLNDEVPF